MKAAKWLGLATLAGVLYWHFSSPAKVLEPLVEPASTATESGIVAAPMPVAEIPTAPPAPSSQAKPATPEHPAREEQQPKVERPEPKIEQRVLRDEHGNFLKLSQRDARDACAKQGMRLPTIRELAKIAMGHGAKGILEASQVQAHHREEGYAEIQALNLDGKKDTFFYNPTGYISRAGDEGAEAFWSASDCKGCEQGAGGDSVHSFWADGRIHDQYENVAFSVRCVRP